ncbi:PP2C family protein-serine/threonine phosphatase [Thermochromatium tepidum]|uniref:SpoIIE family protein phosphatase n=1 Tax=Thermochromatium tepidum ATCC 43061 TaxID=316276 RepID=A0A6I6E609_THETI|nr:fused response regulator/phosphatase [Thermochromatium tepidum]QGU33272.1 SpoIIE family protein phosphatase [Thermochromatium tepidum ATCC 43061]
MDISFAPDPIALRSPFRSRSPASSSARVLAVDDSPDVLLQIDTALRADYSVYVANSGPRALEILEQVPNIDLILLDVLMPDPDGFATCRRIKTHPEWCRIPLIFLTALDQHQHEVEGLALGAVDYLSKPIIPDLLRARLATHLELARIRVELQQRVEELSEERALIEDILLRLRRDHAFDGRGLRYLMRPVERTSGDLCLAAWTPDGRQWVLVGDFTGHGLTAAMAGPLVRQILYQQCADNVPLATLIATLDRQLHDQLPTGRFMAAHIVEVTADRRFLHLANASMPEALLVSPAGDIEILASRSLALGIAPDARSHDSLQTLEVETGARLLLTSDGLLEATDPNGQPFGVERLVKAYIALMERQGPLEDLLEEVCHHRGQNSIDDDVLILELTL